MNILSRIVDFLSRRNEKSAESDPPTSTRVALLREELRDITTHHIQALGLNQLIYTTCVTGNEWISGHALRNACMLECDPRTFRAHMGKLVKSKLADTRKAPPGDWDRSHQYRLNFDVLLERLRAAGYTLEEEKAEQEASNPIKPHSTFLYDASYIFVSWIIQNCIMHSAFLYDVTEQREDLEEEAEQTVSAPASSEKSDALFADSPELPREPEPVKAESPQEPPPVPAAPPMAPPAVAVPAAGVSPAAAAVFNPPVAYRLLRENGVDHDAAEYFSKSLPLAKLVQQVEALPYRNPSSNMGGMLAQSIRQNWSLPAAYIRAQHAAEQEQKAAAAAAAETSIMPELLERLRTAVALVTASGRRLLIKRVDAARKVVEAVDGQGGLYPVQFSVLHKMQIEGA